MTSVAVWTAEPECNLAFSSCCRLAPSSSSTDEVSETSRAIILISDEAVATVSEKVYNAIESFTPAPAMPTMVLARASSAMVSSFWSEITENKKDRSIIRAIVDFPGFGFY